MEKTKGRMNKPSLEINVENVGYPRLSGTVADAVSVSWSCVGKSEPNAKAYIQMPGVPTLWVKVYAPGVTKGHQPQLIDR